MLSLFVGLVVVFAAVSSGAAQSEVHGRKWKPLPPTAHVVVTVKKGFNDKPMPNAAVIFHAVRDGENDGNLEVKTDPEGKATIDVIEVGSHVTLQVIANGFATHAEEFDVTGPQKELEVKMLRPQAQVSSYVDNTGKASDVKPGVQEPPKPIKPSAVKPQAVVPPVSPVTTQPLPPAQPPATTGPPQ
jgi:hypothetical protein